MSYILGQKEFTLELIQNISVGGESSNSALSIEGGIDYLYVPLIDGTGTVKKINLTDYSYDTIYTTPTSNGNCYSIYIDKINQNVITMWRYMSTGDDSIIVFDFDGNEKQIYTTGVATDSWSGLDLDTKRNLLITVNAFESKIFRFNYNGTLVNPIVSVVDSGYSPSYVTGNYELIYVNYDSANDIYIVNQYSLPTIYLPIQKHNPVDMSSIGTINYDRSVLGGWFSVFDLSLNAYIMSTGKDIYGGSLETQSIFLLDSITKKIYFKFDEPIESIGFYSLTPYLKSDIYIAHTGSQIRFYKKKIF